MARQTAKGLQPKTAISVARDGRRRARGTVIRSMETTHGVYVAYRDERTGAERLAALENVRVDRVSEKRRKATKPVRRKLLDATSAEVA